MTHGEPPRDSVAEKISFYQQIPNTFNRSKEPSELRERVLDEAEKLYRPACWFARPFPVTERELRECGREILFELNKKASPGFPLVWQGVSDNAAVMSKPHLTGVVLDKFARLMQLIKEKQDLPNPVVRLFIKGEPHKHAKLRAGLYRLIWALPIEYQMVHRFFLGASVAAEISCWRRIPTKTGYASVYGKTAELFRDLDDGSDRNAEADKSSWDISTPAWLQEWERDSRWRLCLNPEQAHFKDGFNECYRTLMISDVVFSDGTMCRQEIAGIVRSGGLITISGNSRMQVLLKIAFCFAFGKSFSELRHKLVAMGDDTLERMHGVDETAYTSWLTSLGFKVKHMHVGPLLGMEFCSHRFEKIDGCIVPVPVNWQKHMFAMSWKEQANHQFFGLQLLSLMAEYAFDNEKFLSMSEVIRVVEPRLYRSQQCLQNFIRGYEGPEILPSLNSNERHALCVQPELSSLRKLYGLKYQCPGDPPMRGSINLVTALVWILLFIWFIQSGFPVVPGTALVCESKTDSLVHFLPSRVAKRVLEKPVVAAWNATKQGVAQVHGAVAKTIAWPFLSEQSKERWNKSDRQTYGMPKKQIKGTTAIRVELKKELAKKVAKVNRAARRAAVVASVASAAPLRVGKMMKRKAFLQANRFGMDHAVFRGRDLVTKILLSGAASSSTTGKDIAGTLLWSAPIRPTQLIPNARLARLVGLFQKFRIQKMKFCFESGIPSGSNAGSMLFVQEPDPNEALPTQFAAPTAGTLSNYDSHSSVQIVPMAQVPKALGQSDGERLRTDLALGLQGGWLLVDPQNKATAVENTFGQFAIFVQDVHNIMGANSFLPTAEYEIGSLFVEYEIAVEVAADAADIAGGYSSYQTGTVSPTAYANPGAEATTTFSTTGGIPLAVGFQATTKWFARNAFEFGIKNTVQFDGNNEWWGFPESGVYFCILMNTTVAHAADFGTTASGWAGWTHAAVTGAQGSVLETHANFENATSAAAMSGPASFAIIDVEDPGLDFFSPGSWTLGAGGSSTVSTGISTSEMRVIALPPEATGQLRKLLRRERKEKEESERVMSLVMAKLALLAPGLSLVSAERKEEKKLGVDVDSPVFVDTFRKEDFLERQFVEPVRAVVVKTMPATEPRFLAPVKTAVLSRVV